MALCGFNQSVHLEKLFHKWYLAHVTSSKVSTGLRSNTVSNMPLEISVLDSGAELFPQNALRQDVVKMQDEAGYKYKQEH